MFEKAKAFIQERIGENVDIWIADTSLNHLCSLSDKVIFSQGRIRMRFGDEELIFEMKSYLLGEGGCLASAKVVKAFGYEAPVHPTDCRIF